MPIDAVVADANVLLSAVVGKAALRVVTELGVTVHVSELNASEVEEYLPHLSAKYGLPEDLVELQWRLLPIVRHPERDYAEQLPTALERLRERDPEDAHALALAWTLGIPLWSNDRDFEGQPVERFTTAAVLVGGTAAALHAGHRRSHDGDHVLADLRERFDDVLATLESIAGWRTERVQRPVLVLGDLDGVPTGIRQLRRTAPLEVETVEGLTVPTVAEMARIKAWLLATRNTVSDYLDLVVLLERLGDGGAAAALAFLDALYPQPRASVTAEVVERLASASPADLPEVELAVYKGLVAPWNRWEHVKARGRHFAELLIRELLGGATP